jgi:hypothetical protein
VVGSGFEDDVVVVSLGILVSKPRLLDLRSIRPGITSPMSYPLITLAPEMSTVCPLCFCHYHGNANSSQTCLPSSEGVGDPIHKIQLHHLVLFMIDELLSTKLETSLPPQRE